MTKLAAELLRLLRVCLGRMSKRRNHIPGTGLLHKQAHLDSHAVLLAVTVPGLHPDGQPRLCRKVCGLRTVVAVVEARVVRPCMQTGKASIVMPIKLRMVCCRCFYCGKHGNRSAHRLQAAGPDLGS